MFDQILQHFISLIFVTTGVGCDLNDLRLVLQGISISQLPNIVCCLFVERKGSRVATLTARESLMLENFADVLVIKFNPSLVIEASILVTTTFAYT